MDTNVVQMNGIKISWKLTKSKTDNRATTASSETEHISKIILNVLN